MAQTRISIGATPREPISVDLIGVEYLITPPKSMVAIVLAERVKAAGEDPGALLAEMEGWVKIAFGPKQAAKVAARLADPDDLLDIQHIMDLMTKIAEAGTSNPST